MNLHKPSILSKSSNFWFQLKNLFKVHGQTENYVHGNVSTSISYPNRLNSEAVYPWQYNDQLRQDRIFQDSKKWKNNWRNFISPEIASYNHTPGKGLSDITVNLCNKTSVKIDYLQIKVLYFLENGKLYKSEYSELFDVSPLSIQKVPVYSSPVGSTLKVYITHVVATALDLAFSQDSYE